jgi:hypothetical protein
MSTEKTTKQLQQEVLANYEKQIAILESIVESDNRIIELYKALRVSSDKYIEVLKDQVSELNQQVSRML